MSIFTYLDGALVASSNIRLRSEGNQGYEGLPSSADGTGSQGGIIFDDAAGSLSVTGWQIVKVVEADCTSAPVLFYGTIADHTERRGKYRQGASREIDTTINDSNGFLSLRLIGGTDCLRPEETDTERLAWLLSDPCLDGLVFDLGFVNGADRTFEATNYRGQYAADVLADLCGPRGQIFFAYWDQSAQKVGLFFDAPGVTTFTSTLSISNVESDITRDSFGEPTGTVYPPYYDGELAWDPSDVYSRIRYVYKGGAVWRNNTTTQVTFFPAPLDYRSFQVENERVGKRSTAITFADRILAADSEERSTLTFTVRLPSTKVGLIQAGMRIHCRFTHLTGFDGSGAYTRVERLTVVPVDGDPTHYDVRCECSTHGLGSGGGLGPGTGGGSTTPFPIDPTPQTPAHYFDTQFVSTSENYGSSGGSFVPAIGTNTTIDPVTGDQTLVLVEGVTYNVDITITPSPLDAGNNGQVGLQPAGIGSWASVFHLTGLSTVGGVYHYTGTLGPIDVTEAGSYYVLVNWDGAGHVPKNMTTHAIFDPTDWVTGETPEPPSAGNPVSEDVTMTGASGSTSFIFANESLRVFVDDVDHSDDIVTYDGAAKTFQLDFIPYSFEAVRVEYIAG